MKNTKPTLLLPAVMVAALSLAVLPQVASGKHSIPNLALDGNCPVCLVENRHRFHLSPPELQRIIDGLIAAEGTIDTVNLAGGEPTLHPHLLELIGRIPPGALFKWGLRDREPLAPWVLGRVAMLVLKMGMPLGSVPMGFCRLMLVTTGRLFPRTYDVPTATE